MTLRRSPPLAVNRYVPRFVLIRDCHGEPAELHARRVDQGFGKHDVGRYRRFTGGSKRPVGHAQRSLPHEGRIAPIKAAPDSSELIKAVIADFETDKGRSDLQ